MLDEVGARAVLVRTTDELQDVQCLVIPGGESTTIGKLLERFGLLEALRRRASEDLPLFGTCAGLILMAREVIGDDRAPHRLGTLDVSVRRNAYGRQAQSFESSLSVASLESPLRAAFIRAPAIERVGEGVQVLATHESRPVLVRQGPHLASSFHPEITHDPRVHKLFVDHVASRIR